MKALETLKSDSFWQNCWQTIVTVAVIWTAIWTPIDFVLRSEITSQDLIWDTILSSVFYVDLFLRFMGKFEDLYERKAPIWEFQKEKIAYRKTLWPIVDFISSIPFDLVVFQLGLSSVSQFFPMLRMLRITRVIKLRFLLNSIEFIPKALKVSIILGCVGLVLHWIACGWMFITPHDELTAITFYNVGLYWTVTTLTTVGYGDIVPTTNIGRLYTMFVMIIGVGTYGVIIGNFSRIIMLADKNNEEKKEKMASLHTFLKHYNIPTGTQKQVFRFYQHLLVKRITDQDNKIINELPDSLKNELQLYMKIKLIKNLHIFQGCSIPCLKLIAQSLEQRFYSPNEYIVKKGDEGSEMFIISHGDVQVQSSDTVLASLKEGQFFGEFALIEDTVRNADVMSNDYCDIYVFNQKDFEIVTDKYPDLREKFNRVHIDRVQKSVKNEAA